MNSRNTFLSHKRGAQRLSHRQLITRQPVELLAELWKYQAKEGVTMRHFVEVAIRNELRRRGVYDGVS